MKTTLIQLIGKQMLPNIYPVMALRPDILVNVYSEDTRKHEQTLMATVHQAIPDLKIEIQSIYLTVSPSTEETQKKVQAYIERTASDQNVIITNYTGGTKLMSIGAYLAAKESATASIYLNTQLHKFCDGGTSSYSVVDRLLNGDESTKKLSLSLGLHTILTAHQFSMKLAKHNNNTERNEKLLTLAHAIDEWTQSTPEKRLKLYEDEKKALKHPQELLLKKFDFGEKINRLCVDAKLMKWQDETLKKDMVIFAASQLNANKLKSHIKSTHNFLSGSWWELLLFSALKKQTALKEILWSVNVRNREGIPSEEDILARINTELICFSCKISDFSGHIFAELHKLASNTKSMGGSLSLPVLAIYNFANKSNEKELREIADTLNIEIITRENLNTLGDIKIFKNHHS